MKGCEAASTGDIITPNLILRKPGIPGSAILILPGYGATTESRPYLVLEIFENYREF